MPKGASKYCNYLTCLRIFSTHSWRVVSYRLLSVTKPITCFIRGLHFRSPAVMYFSRIRMMCVRAETWMLRGSRAHRRFFLSKKISCNNKIKRLLFEDFSVGRNERVNMSFIQLLYHVVIRTKSSEPTLSLEHSDKLYRYISGIMNNKSDGVRI